jgi:hypothetical protein
MPQAHRDQLALASCVAHHRRGIVGKHAGHRRQDARIIRTRRCETLLLAHTIEFWSRPTVAEETAETCIVSSLKKEPDGVTCNLIG